MYAQRGARDRREEGEPDTEAGVCQEVFRHSACEAEEVCLEDDYYE